MMFLDIESAICQAKHRHQEALKVAETERSTKGNWLRKFAARAKMILFLA